MTGVLLGLWRARWGVLRLALVLLLLWVVAADSAARLARLQLASLPDIDYLAEVRALRDQGRYGEALLVADAGIGASGGEAQIALLREKQATEAEQRSLARRFRDAGRGALTGLNGAPAEGPEASIESLAGAVAADLFVFGDVRDLVIQSARLARGDRTDPVIAALSIVGVVTTFAPQVDWAPALLKAGRKLGVLSDRLGGFIVRAVRERRVKDLEPLLSDVAAMARHASPGGAVRLLRYADDPADVARTARFLERHGSGGAFALHATGAHGADALRAADRLRAAGRAEDAAHLETITLRAARKGEAGGAWLARGSYRALLRPHPILGLAKGLWKGTAAAFLQRALEAIDGRAWWLLPALGAWALLECGLLLRRLRGSASRGNRWARAAEKDRGSRSKPMLGCSSASL